MNPLLKLINISQVMDYFDMWLGSPYHSNCRKLSLDTHIFIKL